MAVSNTKKTLKGISSQTIVTIARGIVEIIAFSILSRLLTQSDFGYFAAICAVMIVFSSISETGIGSALIQRKIINSKYINNAFTLCLFFGLLSSVSLFLLSGWIAKLITDEAMALPLRLMSLTLLCQSMTSAYAGMLVRELRFLTVGAISLASLVLTYILSIILALKGFGYYAIITRIVLYSILVFVLIRYNSKVKFKLEWEKDTIKEVWSYSGWLMGSVVLRNFAQQMDRLLFSRLLSVSLLGAYNRPKEFINQVTNQLGGIFDTALFPVLSQVQDNLYNLRRAYHKSYYLLNLASMFLALGCFYNADLIIKIFFGEEWLNTLNVLKVLSVAIIFMFNARLADCYMRSLGLTKQQFFFRALEVFLKVAAVFIGYRYGLMGIAISVTFAEIISVTLKHIFLIKRLEISIIDNVKSMVDSWRLVIILVIVYILVNSLPINPLCCDIVKLCVFTSFICISLFFAPILVGKIYKVEYHTILKEQIERILKKTRKI